LNIWLIFKVYVEIVESATF